ncbi:EAL domain-containing protein [Pseudomonas guariconensis]|uniref:EAL domain-containing protein n=1 Tax=Pseudomonas guariconensis TaxID=1288410 RepID=UPI0039066B44
MSKSNLTLVSPANVAAEPYSALSLVYQPVYRVTEQHHRVVAFESLLRVNKRGALSPPADLVAQAETDGSIVDIDRWVLAQVVRLLRSRPRLWVWVNTSQLSIAHPTFIEEALETLSEADVLGRVSFEVTETADVDVDTLAARLKVLKLRALTVLVDDIRDGFAKRSLLASSAVAGCKLSRETTRELMVCERTRADVRDLVTLCREQGKQVVLEGIETTAELDLAKELKISLCQGYFLGVPEPVDKLAHHPEMQP